MMLESGARGSKEQIQAAGGYERFDGKADQVKLWKRQ